MAGKFAPGRVVVRGAGEMASGVIHFLFKSGYEVIALEQPNPTCVRRYVCFAEAVYDNKATVENVTAVLVDSSAMANKIFACGEVPILIDSDAELLFELGPMVLVDARMTKKESDCSINLAPIVIGLGPGFRAGINCHAVIETNRGQNLGQVIYDGAAQPATGEPSRVKGVSHNRVIRSPGDGVFRASGKITDSVSSGDIIGEVDGQVVKCLTGGIIRGLIRDGLKVSRGQKVGDIDPRGERERCHKISNKAITIAHGVDEALRALRSRLSAI